MMMGLSDDWMDDDGIGRDTGLFMLSDAARGKAAGMWISVELYDKPHSCGGRARSEVDEDFSLFSDDFDYDYDSATSSIC